MKSSVGTVAECKRAIDQAKAGNLKEALEKLLDLEKKTRKSEDLHSNSEVILTTIRLCFELQSFDLLNEHILSFSKKHGHLRQAIYKMVIEAITYIDKIEDQNEKYKFLTTLRSVTEGKIFLEIERARVTIILAKMKESSGETLEALELLSELQVQTFGSMSRQEKTEFFLEQMRLSLLHNDYMRVLISSKNIDLRIFALEENVDMKLRYYEIMVQRALYEREFLETCKCYMHIYNTNKIKEDINMWPDIFKNCVLFSILSSYSNERQNFIHILKNENNLSKIPKYKDLIKSFATNDLLNWPEMKMKYSSLLCENPHMAPTNPNSEFYWEELHKRVIEHSIRVIASAYDCISMSRLAELLNLDVNQAEEMLADLVIKKVVYARVDRPLRIVSFRSPKSTDDILNEWNYNIQSILNIIVKTNHLITKEEMVQNAVRMKH